MTTKIIQVHCNKCGGERRHEVLHHESVTWEDVIDDRYKIDGGNAYDLVKCCGCENVALRHQTWFSEDMDEQGRPNVKTVLYPPESYRPEPRWLTELIWALPIDNNFVSEFIQEIYVALRNKSLRLAVMGIRALLEQIMIDKIGDKGSFKKNLDAFEVDGFVSHGQRMVLEPVLEAGHAAMHRAFRPTSMDAGHLMDITESIIESIYVNAHRASELSKRVPSKSKKGGASA
jgi:hypothetical protein